MFLPDVNVLVYAHRSDTEHHGACRAWLEQTIGGPSGYAVSDLVLSGFVRVVTHPRVFKKPSDLATALSFCTQVRSRPNCVRVVPSPRHWSIFLELSRAAAAKGNLIPDAYLAALALDAGCEWVTTDGDFARFPGLRVVSPLS